MSIVVQDERVARYVALVREGKDVEADELLTALHEEAHARLGGLQQRQESFVEEQESFKPRSSRSKMYRDLLTLYRDATVLAKWASAAKKAMREAKRVRDADVVTEEQR